MKRAFHVAFATLWGVLSLSFAEPESESPHLGDVEQALQRVDQLREQGMIMAAIQSCDELIRTNRDGPYRAKALLARAELKSLLEDFGGALGDICEAEAIGSDVFKVNYLKGVAQNGLGSYPEAVKCLSRALKLDPRNPNVLFNRALSYYRLGFFDLAESDLSTAIRIEPRDFALYWRRGAIRFECGSYRASTEDLLRAITINPSASNRYREYGLAQYFLGRIDVATNYFSKYAELGGKSESERSMLLGSCYLEAGDSVAAVGFYDRAIGLNPDCDVCYSDRALAKYLQNNVEGALGDITQAITFAPALGSRYQIRGILRLIQKRYETAHADFGRQIALTRENEGGIEGGYIGLVSASLLSGLPDRAVAEAQEALSKRIWRAEIWLWCNLLGVTTGREYDERMLAFAPSAWPHVLVRYYLGQVNAAEVLACADHPNPAIARRRLTEAHFYIGAALASKSNNEAAKREFAQCVKADQIKWPVVILAQEQLERDWFSVLRQLKTSQEERHSKVEDKDDKRE
jgi:tetratricopeptide (TPR) repeat protein